MIITADIIRIRASVGNGLSPEDACELARAFDDLKMACHALRVENAELRAAVAHLEALRERDLNLSAQVSTLPPSAPDTIRPPPPPAPDTVSVEDPLKFDKEGV